MMYNVARALALIGLVGVSATNTTSTANTTGTGGSTAPPQTGGCSDWTGLTALTDQIGARRQLSNHTTSTPGCVSSDVPKCLYASVTFTGAKSSIVNNTNGNAGCPTSYPADDGTKLKTILATGLCLGNNACVTKTVLVIKLKLKCKSGTGTLTAAGGDRRQLTQTDVTLQLSGSVHLPEVITGANSITAQAVGNVLHAIHKVGKAALATAMKTVMNTNANPTGPSVLANINDVTPAITEAKIALTDATNCNTLSAIEGWKASQCAAGSTNAAKNMCVYFTGPTGSGSGSNAISFVVSSLVMAAAVLI